MDEKGKWDKTYLVDKIDTKNTPKPQSYFTGIKAASSVKSLAKMQPPQENTEKPYG